MFQIKHCNFNTAIFVIAIITITIIIVTLLQSKTAEFMSPLDFGTFKNDYKFGHCGGSGAEILKRSPCMVGNCHIGTNITNKEYCDIHCAQISDRKMKHQCTSGCLNLMKKCNEPQ